ncbi:hypothetical protein NC651_039180 [Populus alba x Populus x berolinensis]|nr:hypothetical protein NC651_039180 [Populus alba x Populus x berolinensis]
MAKLVEEARNSKSKTRRFIDKFAQYYTSAVIFMPAGVAVIPLALRVHNRDHWFYLALTRSIILQLWRTLLFTGKVSSIESKSSHPMAAAL